MVWNEPRIIVSILGGRGVPSLQSFSNAKIAFVNDIRILKIYAVVEWPHMFCNGWSIATYFDIPDIFCLTSFKGVAHFNHITPITIGTVLYISMFCGCSISHLFLHIIYHFCISFFIHWMLLIDSRNVMSFFFNIFSQRTFLL